MGSLPYNIRVNVNVPFPALVAGAAGIRVTKQNGIWTIAPDYTVFPITGVISPANLANTYILVWNALTGIFTLVPMSSITTAIVPTLVNFAQSPYAVQLTDTILYVDTSGGPVIINLPLSASRNGFSISIKDVTGNAAANNISIVRSGAETIDGLTTLPVNANYGGYRLTPKTAGYIIAP